MRAFWSLGRPCLAGGASAAPAPPSPNRPTARVLAKLQRLPCAQACQNARSLKRRSAVFGGRSFRCSSAPFAKPPDCEGARKAPALAAGSSLPEPLQPQDACLTLMDTRAVANSILRPRMERLPDALLEIPARSFRLVFNCSWYDRQAHETANGTRFLRVGRNADHHQLHLVQAHF